MEVRASGLACIDPEVQATGWHRSSFTAFGNSCGRRCADDVVDSEADNLPALYFFRKMGFGSPQEHIYLALNLDPHLRQYREKNRTAIHFPLPDG